MDAVVSQYDIVEYALVAHMGVHIQQKSFDAAQQVARASVYQYPHIKLLNTSVHSFAPDFVTVRQCRADINYKRFELFRSKLRVAVAQGILG